MPFFLRVYPVRTLQTVAAMQNGAKGHLHCFCQPIWIFWQYAKHLQHSSHDLGPPLSLVLCLCLTFLNCVGLSQQWLASCGVLSQPWPAVGVRKSDQLLKAFHTAHCASTYPKRVEKIHCNLIPTTMVRTVNKHGNGTTVHKHSGQVGYNIYESGFDFFSHSQ